MRDAKRGLVVAVAVGAAVVAAAAAPSAEAKRARVDPALFRRPLVLTSFVQNGRTDVGRNESLVFRFSAVVDRRSLDARSLRVLEVTGAGRRQAVGALVAQVNVVRFDPEWTQRGWDDAHRGDGAAISADHVRGFPSYTDFVVEVPGAPERHTLRNARRAAIRTAFSGRFSTSGSYADPVPGQPWFVGIAQTGNLGFDPPRSGASGLVDEDAEILLEFSEPIDLATLEPTSTVRVVRARTGEDVPGSIREDVADTSGRRYRFVPSLGFGSDLANESGWDVQVTLTTGIRDLAGNPLKRGWPSPVFRTRYVPGKQAASILSETFADQSRMDPVTTAEGGEWSTAEAGALVGGQPTAFPPQDVSYWRNPPAGTTPVFTRQNFPLVSGSAQAGCLGASPLGSRTQLLWIPADVGASGAVVSMGWGPSSNALFGALHPEITIRLGHTSQTALGPDLDANVDIGAALEVWRGPYAIPQAKNIKPADGTNAAGVTRDPSPPPPGNPTGMWSFPAFTAPFEWNGTNNLVVDVAAKAANNCQIIRAAYFPAAMPVRRAVSMSAAGTQSDLAGTPDPVVYDWSFSKRRRTTRATSRWYELPSDAVQFAAPIVSPATQSGGVTVVVEMEGAPGRTDPLAPGSWVPDPARGTGFTTDVAQIDGHRFLRFRVTMVANLSSNRTARITSIQFPYRY